MKKGLAQSPIYLRVLWVQDCQHMGTVTTYKVLEWAVCKEENQQSEGDDDKYHFQMAVKLNYKVDG